MRNFNQSIFIDKLQWLRYAQETVPTIFPPKENVQILKLYTSSKSKHSITNVSFMNQWSNQKIYITQMLSYSLKLKNYLGEKKINCKNKYVSHFHDLSLKSFSHHPWTRINSKFLYIQIKVIQWLSFFLFLVQSSAVKALSPNHWITREFLIQYLPDEAFPRTHTLTAHAPGMIWHDWHYLIIVSV